ncbi:MAG: ABC transporter six-transmembrane domain-containing protein [Carboxylicivirga sp.]|jgi:ABC-type multidrug transport system fused ATPase/permease subunit|nr:ABC transporter six-transmembrane domain-containing protein [Carboxylicivirga sp.]
MLIKQVFAKYWMRLSLTLLLILLEALLVILFPLYIGKAIDGVMNNELVFLWQLCALGLLLTVTGAGRRLLDSRFYAGIYTKVSRAAIKKMKLQDDSVKTARLNMLAEVVEFAENQLPAIIQHSIGLIVVALIILFLNLKIFMAAILCGSLVLCIYFLSSKRTLRLNSEFNNELENQVNTIQQKQESALHRHLLKLMRWNIRLSDLETLNFSGSWLIMLVLLVISIHIAATGENIQYGALMALIMYVYQFIESMVSLPLFYQQWLRLSEISERIRNN